MSGEGTFADQLRRLESESAEKIWQKLLDIETCLVKPPAACETVSDKANRTDGNDEERRIYRPPRTRNGLRGEAPCTPEDLEEWRPLVARVLAVEKAKLAVSTSSSSAVADNIQGMTSAAQQRETGSGS
jgi:hypothetical protein